MNAKEAAAKDLEAAVWRRDAAANLERIAYERLLEAVRFARLEAGMSAIEIAEQIGMTRQRVYEILREG